MNGRTVMPAAIRGIVFDVDGTLYHQPPVRVLVLARLVARHLLAPRALARVARILGSFRRAMERLRAARSAAGSS